MHLKQYIGPSDSKTTPNDPISYTMIVYGRLDLFLAISKFFDSYRAVASPGKLDKTPKLALFEFFFVRIALLGVSKSGQKMAINRPISVGTSIFWILW